MTAMGGYFGLGFSVLFITLVTIILFVFTWFWSHGVTHMAHTDVDLMSGDEGDD